MKILRFLFQHLISLCALLFALIVVGVAHSVSLPPSVLRTLCLSWFAFPYLWLSLCLVSLLLIYFHHTLTALFCIAALIFTSRPASLVIGFDTPDDLPSADSISSSDIHVLSYNVSSFVYSHDQPLYTSHLQVAHLIDSLNADIVCLQEIPNERLFDKLTSDTLKAAFGRYPYQLTSQHTNGCQIVLSRFPLTQFPDTLHGALLCSATLPTGRDVLLFNCHLASLRLSITQVDAVTQQHMDSTRSVRLYETYSRLRSAFLKREKEVNDIAHLINSDTSSSDVIVCGDFNDTPISYTYHTFTHISHPKPLVDAFRPQYYGLARTYRGNLPPLRIDFLLSTLQPIHYVEHNLPSSDHKAIEVYLRP